MYCQRASAEVAREGLRQFDAALSLEPTDDPVADLLAIGAAYRRYAIDKPHMYRLMFGSTSANGINVPAGNVLNMTVTEIEQLKIIVREEDSHAFITVIPANEIVGEGFIPLEERH